MHIEQWPLDKIRPYPNNPRVMRNAAEKVADSLREFGPRQPIVVDEDGVIIIGHTRLAAAKLLKLETFPVHVATGLSADQVRALRIADNKTGEFAQWDDARLHDELAEIMAGLGSVTVTGFSLAEFDAIEQQARAEIERISAASMVGKRQEPVAQDDQADDFDAGQEPDDVADESTPAGRPADTPPPVDLVPFNVLMTVDARQVVYDAVAKAKATGLATTADALHAICRGYCDA